MTLTIPEAVANWTRAAAEVQAARREIQGSNWRNMEMVQRDERWTSARHRAAQLLKTLIEDETAGRYGLPAECKRANGTEVEVEIRGAHGAASVRIYVKTTVDAAAMAAIAALAGVVESVK